MRILGKDQKNSKLVETVISRGLYLKYSQNDIDFYDDYDLFTNFCILVPFDPYHLYIEIAEIDYNQKLHFNLRGISVKNDLDFSYASVGELTLNENIIVNFDEILRISIPESNHYNPMNYSDKFDMFNLDVFCKDVFSRYLYNRIYCSDKNFYIQDPLSLY